MKTYESAFASRCVLLSIKCALLLIDYISGIIAVRDSEATPTPDTFSVCLRTAFRELGRQLEAYQSGLRDVVMLTTFHDWAAPEFSGDAKAQAKAFQSIKDEFIPEPHPVWTAIGTTGFVLENGILEMQAIAFSPRADSTARNKHGLGGVRFLPSGARPA